MGISKLVKGTVTEAPKGLAKGAAPVARAYPRVLGVLATAEANVGRVWVRGGSYRIKITNLDCGETDLGVSWFVARWNVLDAVANDEGQCGNRAGGPEVTWYVGLNKKGGGALLRGFFDALLAHNPELLERTNDTPETAVKAIQEIIESGEFIGRILLAEARDKTNNKDPNKKFTVVDFYDDAENPPMQILASSTAKMPDNRAKTEEDIPF